MIGRRLVAALTRKRTFTEGSLAKSELSRCMTLTDLTLLGVGATLGLGVYVLAGDVAKHLAGPGVVLSFLVAAIASAFAGICYAEFSCRCPRAGSAYVYSYVCVGEFIAFIIGWNLILEYVIGAASVARGLVGYIDAQFDDAMAKYMRAVMPMDVAFLSPHPDFLAFLILMLLAAVLSAGVKESTILNNVFTFVNIFTIAVVIGAGSFKADVANWSIPKESIPADVDGGDGGFLPWGVAGVMSGAAQCFYGFVGFDAVATTGEEAQNPQRNIPLAIVISLTIIFFAYFGISVVLTMMWPYYDQNVNAPLPYVFTKVGWPVVTWIVTVGAVFALCTAMLGAMFPLPRVLYAMAKDGLIFKFLAKVNPKRHTPIVATLTSGFIAGVMAILFDLHHLVEMLSIGTLLAYTIVAVCVLILRYEDPVENEVEYPAPNIIPVTSHMSRAKRYLVEMFNLNMTKIPTKSSSMITKWAIAIFCTLSTLFCAVMCTCFGALCQGQPWAIFLTAILVVAMLILLIVMARQPTTTVKLQFKVPLVPVVPAASVIINTYLMMQLEQNTWIRFAVWMTVGFLIYFLYGLKHSVEGARERDIGLSTNTLSTSLPPNPEEENRNASATRL